MERATEFNHNHAAAGTSNGGQFVSSSSAARTTKSTGQHRSGHTRHAKQQVAHIGGNPRSTKSLQKALNRLLGLKLDVDGKFGPKTEAAVKQIQTRLGLKADGKVSTAFLSHLAHLKSLRATASEEPMDTRTAEADTKPYGNVSYADPGYQKDKKERYPLDTEKHVRAAWDYIHQAKNAALYSAQQLKDIEGRIKAAGKKLGITFEDAAKESFIGNTRTFDEIKDLVRDALTDREQQGSGSLYCYVYIADITDTDVVYTCADEDDLMQCSYEIGDDESVTLGDPVEVVRTYAPADTVRNPPPEADETLIDMDDATESTRDRVAGRVLEAKGTNADGGRVFRTRIIAYGDSRNGRRYPEAVMREAVGLYEGAKAYDHHRTQEELQTSTITGLVGHYRDVQAEADGLYGDLHLLPSATHTAEVLDASLSAQEAGHEPSVGISHDVQCHFRPIVDAGRRMQEAVQIASVDSADVVAKPSAGGKAVRAVAGGETTTEEELDVPPTKADVLAAFKEATDEDLAAVGLARATKTTESTTEPSPPATTLQRATEGEPERTTEAAQPKTSFLGKLLIRQKVEDAGLPVAVTESVSAALPDRITESDVDAQIAGIKAGLGIIERHTLTPTATATVTQEAQEKKVEALDKFFAGDFSGYRSFREAVLDFTGYRPRSYGEDVNRAILRECIGDGQYDTDGRLQRGQRTTESLSASSWNLVLGDSITRRLVAEYHQPNLMTWRQIVSSIVPINDFRTQRIDRIGGYGVLPTVNQGAPYQPLTSPTNEEVTYAIGKRGGTEDVTLEMIANDDVRAIARIPKKLGLAAANTIYQYVWNFLISGSGGATIYDGTALFTGTGAHANFVNNASGSVLSQSALSAARLLMGSQTAYGDAQDFIRPVPQYLITGLGLEELAWQLCTSAVALPAPANTPPDSTGAANTPNLHQSMVPIVIPNITSATAWFVAADPNLIPTFELGYYLGREDPELFTQSDPTVGSVFNADKVTYKIRHIYNGNVLDYRGFVKGNA